MNRLSEEIVSTRRNTGSCVGQLQPDLLGQYTTNKKTRKEILLEVDEDSFEEFMDSLRFALSKDKDQVAMRRELLIL